MGRILRIRGAPKSGSNSKDNDWNYADLDEIIFSHVRAMARKVEEMMLHEKYKGSRDELGASPYLLVPARSSHSVQLNSCRRR